MFQNILEKLYLLPLILISLSVHEVSHGLVAYKLGDGTAKNMGRLSLNPLVHIDIIGTLSMMFFGFGWAKPVPVNFGNLKYKRLGPILVSLAGPFSNIILAIICYCIYVVLQVGGVWGAVGEFFTIYALSGVVLNAVLAAFNIIPIPPLDGSRIVLAFLPYKWQFYVYKYEPIVNIVLFALLYMGVLSPLIDMIAMLVLSSIQGVVSLIFHYLS
ncbi:MAG: site-2 protease family protein [Clostridia bacterium]|nr:site-2 protease family protein [Clostridia bacterium]